MARYAHLLNRLLRGIIAVLSLGITFGAASAYPQPTYAEYEVKAAFLFNFANYVEWPETVLDERSSLDVCVVADEALRGTFSKIPQITQRNRPLRLTYFTHPSQIDPEVACHMLFVATGYEGMMEEIFRNLQDRPVLLVTDSEGNSIISFVLREQKVRFVVDLSRARHVGLRVSSQLLKVAISVKGGSQ